ncbi:MAG: hypothetical protein R3Y60_01730 [bacterium]
MKKLVLKHSKVKRSIDCLMYYCRFFEEVDTKTMDRIETVSSMIKIKHKDNPCYYFTLGDGVLLSGRFGTSEILFEEFASLVVGLFLTTNIIYKNGKYYEDKSYKYLRRKDRDFFDHYINIAIYDCRF